MSEPRVDVIISTLNEERALDACFDTLAAQTEPHRVIVVDGGSTDGTVRALQRRAATDPRIVLVADGQRRTLPAALNIALEHTSAPFVAKVDARTFLAPDFLAHALQILDSTGTAVACVGGAPAQFGETPFGRALAKARTSRFGVGGSQYADMRACADVETVQCGVYRRSALAVAGRFDPALQFGEDEELNWRLRRAGYRIVRDDSIRLSYMTRSTWHAAFAQYRNYGRARVAVACRHPAFLRPYHAAPAIMLLGGGTLALAAPFVAGARTALVTGVLAYAAASIVAAAYAARGERDAIVRIAAAFPALHAGYGLGTIEGAISKCLARSRVAVLRDTARAATSESDLPPTLYTSDCNTPNIRS